MTPERWREVKDVFNAVVECPPSDGASLLDRLCGNDDELRAEVETLLTSDRQQIRVSLPPPLVAAIRKVSLQFGSLAGPAGDPVALKLNLLLSGRYELVAELGAGGMSVVYLALDRQLLDKRVVVKVLMAKADSDAWMRRKFQQEIEALARIDHPGVVSVSDSGLTDEGRRFLVMQFVEGATLRAAIGPEGMDFRRAAKILRHVGAALEAAHEKGVWHRDLKPENIMLHSVGGEERVKVIDFGIAGIQDSRYSGEQTKIAGTLTYMAPEQFTGHPCAASDTYALGVVAYEMVTGHRPFTMDSMLHLLSEKKTVLISPDELRSDLPVAAQRSILKAMAFLSGERHLGIREFTEELALALEGGQSNLEEAKQVPRKILQPTKWTVVAALATATIVGGALWYSQVSGTWTREQPSVAVMPFSDLSGEPNQAYFSDGLAEELLNSLAKVRGLRVTGRTSSFQLRKSSEQFAEIGEKLHVSSVLVGSVRKQGTRAKITVRLIKTSDGFSLWSETFDRELNDIFQVQEEIAHAVTAALKITLLDGKTAPPAARRTHPDAYNAYLQGRYLYSRNDRPSLEQAAALFEKALQIDPGFAPGWVALGEAHSAQAALSLVPAGDGYSRAAREIETALQLDNKLGEALSALGRIKMLYNRDWAAANSYFQRALELEPGNARLIRRMGNLAMFQGDSGKAIGLFSRSIEIDPLNTGGYYDLGMALYYKARYDEAEVAFKKRLALDPNRIMTHSRLSQIYLLAGRAAEALREAIQEKDAAYRLYGQALVYHALGQKSQSDANLNELISRFQADNCYQIAEVYGFRRETDKAFEWLERAYASHDSGLAELAGDPMMRGLEGDPRYAPFVIKANRSR